MTKLQNILINKDVSDFVYNIVCIFMYLVDI